MTGARYLLTKSATVLQVAQLQGVHACPAAAAGQAGARRGAAPLEHCRVQKSCRGHEVLEQSGVRLHVSFKAAAGYHEYQRTMFVRWRLGLWASFSMLMEHARFTTRY
jgi:hypothetical protein